MYHNYKSIPVNQRKTHELRKLRLESNVIPSTSSNSNSYISGSAMIELGRTKVICTVVGPVTSNCPVVPSSMTLSMDRGTVQVQVSYLAHQASMPSHHIPVNAIANNPNMMDVVAHSGSATASKNASPSQQQPILNPKQCQKYIQDQEHDLSLRIQRAISSVILLEQYPKCAIVLQFLILFNDDANIVATCLNVASLALASAQIEMYGVVRASTVATVTMATTPQSLPSLSNRNDDDGKNKNSDEEKVVVLLADPTRDEMSLADSIITIATLSNNNSDDNDGNQDEEIALWEQQTLYNNYTNGSVRGKSGGDVNFNKNTAMDLCFDGGRTMYQFVRQHLLSSSSTTFNNGGDVGMKDDMAVVAPTLPNHKRPRRMIS